MGRSETNVSKSSTKIQLCPYANICTSFVSRKKIQPMLDLSLPLEKTEVSKCAMAETLAVVCCFRTCTELFNERSLPASQSHHEYEIRF